MKTLRIAVAFVSLFALTFATACGDDDGGGQQEICNNLTDDDGDGLTDCADSDCINAANCQASNEICNNMIDDDGDNLADCDDPDCSTATNCQASNEICDNTIDDDGDNLADCDDSDCASDAACQVTGGDLSCVGLSQCYACCPDAACATACDAEGSTAAVSALNDLLTCLNASCQTECASGSDPATCQGCIDTNCATQDAACTWNSTGTTGCMALNTCLNGCSDPLQTGTATTCPDVDGANAGLGCVDACYQDASATGADALNALVDCIFDDAVCGQECPGTNCSTCQQEAQQSGGACNTEAMACQ